MDLLEIGRILGELEGVALTIDVGTLVTSKNKRNLNAKLRLLNLVRELKKELSNKKRLSGTAIPKEPISKKI